MKVVILLIVDEKKSTKWTTLFYIQLIFLAFNILVGGTMNKPDI
jgi:hypothetical protein